MRVGVVGGRMKIVRDEMMADVAIASAGHFKAEPMAVYGEWTNFHLWAEAADIPQRLWEPAVAFVECPVPAPRQSSALD